MANHEVANGLIRLSRGARFKPLARGIVDLRKQLGAKNTL